MVDMTTYGFTPSLLPTDAQGVPARVTAVHRDRFELVCAQGSCYGRLKAAQYYAGGEPFPTTGDYVMIDYLPDGDSRITRTLARRSYFSRLDPSSAGHAEQAIAANFDTVFIMQSLNNNFNLKRMERYLALAWQSGAQPVVVLTKLDLCPDAVPYLRDARDTAIGAEVYAVSARTGEGLSELNQYMQPGQTVVFLGSSGVGKSSLVNALAGEELMPTGEIREDDARGRHTTTHRQLMRLSNGAMVIDTPGMRELGMWDASEGVEHSFADVEGFLGQCRFADCRHHSEPGCAIKAAIADGQLSQDRWERYQALMKEASRAENRLVYDRQKQQWCRDVAMQSRSMKKSGKIQR